MNALKRADLINGSLIFVLAIQSATSLFSFGHRALNMPLMTSRGVVGIEIPWLFVGITILVTIAAAVLILRYVSRTSGTTAAVDHAIGANLWFVGYGLLTFLLTAYYFNTFTSAFNL